MKQCLRYSIALMLLITGGFFQACTKEHSKTEHDAHSQVTNDSENVATKKIYTCPMHPQIKSDKEGICSICHMDLVLVQSEPVESKIERPTGETKNK